MVLAALVGGGHEVLNTQIEAKRAAEQAARAGADALSGSAVRSGTDRIDTRLATSRANEILGEAGWDGTVRIEGTRVIVTVRGTRPSRFLHFVGVENINVEETGTAVAISTPDG